MRLPAHPKISKFFFLKYPPMYVGSVPIAKKVGFKLIIEEKSIKVYQSSWLRFPLPPPIGL